MNEWKRLTYRAHDIESEIPEIALSHLVQLGLYLRSFDFGPLQNGVDVLVSDGGVLRSEHLQYASGLSPLLFPLQPTNSAPCLIMLSMSSLPRVFCASASLPCWMTIESSRSLTSALSMMRSSTVFSVIRRNTRTWKFPILPRNKSHGIYFKADERNGNSFQIECVKIDLA